MTQIQRPPDPQGLIARIRSRLSPNCSVKLSPLCDHIISMRMQGVPFLEIEAWTVQQGEHLRIPSSTIWKNLKKTKLQVNLSWAEEQAEKWGGSIDLDLARELANQILTQKRRVDAMVRHEETLRKANPRYADKRIRQEIETLSSLVKTLHSMRKSPQDSLAELLAAEGKLTDTTNLNLSEDAAAVIAQMLLTGELSVGGPDGSSNS